MAAGEVASLAVHVFPEMTGFRAKMMGEAQDAGKSSGSLFARIFSSSGKKAGENAGRSLRTAFRDASKSMSAPGLNKLDEQIRKITRTVSSEHLKMLDAQGKVRVAQAKLNDVVSKYGKDSTQAISAQERLNSAQRKAEQLTGEYQESVKQLKRAQADRNELEKAYAPANYRNAIADIKTYGKAVKDTLAESNKASKAQAEAQKKLEEAVSKYGIGSRQATKAQKELAKAEAQTGKAEGSYTEAVKRLTEAQERASKSAKDYQPPKLNVFQRAIENVRDSLSKLNGVKLGGLHSAFQRAGEAGETLKAKISAGTVAMGTAIGNAVSNAASSVKDFAQDCMSEYNEASEGIAKFNQIAANNKWSETQKASLDELSESLMHVGVIDDDVTRAGQAQLGTFKLSATAVKELTPAMDDMIAHTKGLNASGQDAVAIGNLMGKVMTGSTSALSRYGVTMDASQKKLLQHGTAEQRAATLAKILEQNYGGVNKALAATPAGKVKQFQLNIDDLKKSLGKSFTTVVGAVAPTLTAGLDRARKPVENFTKWFATAVKGLSDAVRTGNINKEMQQAFGVNAKPIVAAINDIKAGFHAAWAGIKQGLSDVAGSAGKAHDKVSPLTDIIKILGKVVRVAGEVVGTLAKHLKSLMIVGGIVVAISGFVKVMTALKGVITAVQVAQAALNIVMSANPIGLIITAVAALVAGLIALQAKFHIFNKMADGIKKAWGGMQKWFGKMWQGIQKGCDSAVKGIQKGWDSAKKGIQKGWNTMGKWAQKTSKDTAKGFNSFKKDVTKHFNDAKKGAQSAWTGMQGWAHRTSSGIAKGFNGIKQGINNHFHQAERGARNIWQSTPSWFRNSVAGRIVSGYASMPGKIIGFFRNPAQGARNIWSSVTGWFNGVPGHISGFFGSMPGRITGFFRSAGDGVKGAWNAVVGWFQGLPGRIVGFFRRLPGEMLSIGQNMMMGIVNGIKGKVEAVKNAITSGVNSAINGVKGFLGIHSPSTKMRDEVGQYIGLGLASGIRQSMPAVSDAMTEMAGIPTSTRVSMPTVRGGSLASAAVAAGQMPVTRDDIMRLTDAVESLHRDLGPTISRWTPTLSGRERARVVRDALAGRY